MPPSKNIQAYATEEALLKQALAANKGIRIRPPGEITSSSWCISQRHRLNFARVADRERSKLLYPEEHVLHGRSNFDCLVITIREDERGSFIEIMKSDGELAQLVIEEIL